MESHLRKFFALAHSGFSYINANSWCFLPLWSESSSGVFRFTEPLCMCVCVLGGGWNGTLVKTGSLSQSPSDSVDDTI